MDGPFDPADLVPDETRRIRFGPYWLTALIGQGGFGEVYLAEHVDLGRRAAVKIMRGPFPEGATIVERFRREAEAACRVDHPGLARVYDFGQVGPHWFMAMEFIAGETVASLLVTQGPQPPERVHDLACQLLKTLVAIHHHGLIHRDLKPANLMIDGAGTLKLLDLGLVKWSDRTRLTEDGSLGTPRYISPEMLLGGEIDGRSDLYQAGLVVYELLVGDPVVPRNLPTVPAILDFVARGDLPAAPSISGERAQPLRQFLERTLVTAPDARFATATEALNCLSPPAPTGAPQGPLSAVRRRAAPAPARSAQSPPAVVNAATSFRWHGVAGAAVVLGVLAGAWHLRSTADQSAPKSSASTALASSRSASLEVRAGRLVDELEVIITRLRKARILHGMLEEHDRFAKPKSPLEATQVRAFWIQEWSRACRDTGLHRTLGDYLALRPLLSPPETLTMGLRGHLVYRLNELMDYVEFLEKGYRIPSGVNADDLELPGSEPLTQAPARTRLLGAWVIGDGGARAGRTVPGELATAVRLEGPALFTRNESDFAFVEGGKRRKRFHISLDGVARAVMRLPAGASLYLGFRATNGELGERLAIAVQPADGPRRPGVLCALRPRSLERPTTGWILVDKRQFDVEKPQLDVNFQGRSFRLYSLGIDLDYLTLWAGDELVRPVGRPPSVSDR